MLGDFLSCNFYSTSQSSSHLRFGIKRKIFWAIENFLFKNSKKSLKKY